MCWSAGSDQAHLNLHKLAFAFVADLEESLTRHVLNTGMSLMHKFKELIHHSLQELPMIAQEAWILPNHIPAGCGQGAA